MFVVGDFAFVFPLKFLVQISVYRYFIFFLFFFLLSFFLILCSFLLFVGCNTRKKFTYSNIVPHFYIRFLILDSFFFPVEFSCHISSLRHASSCYSVGVYPFSETRCVTVPYSFFLTTDISILFLNYCTQFTPSYSTSQITFFFFKQKSNKTKYFYIPKS